MSDYKKFLLTASLESSDSDDSDYFPSQESYSSQSSSQSSSQPSQYSQSSSQPSQYSQSSQSSSDSQLTNRFHVAVHLSSNRSQMTSKCGKNKKVAHEAIAECVTDVLTTF